MLRIRLRLLVLMELKKGEKSGYDLIKQLSSVLESGPSPGQIYPLLHDIESRGLVKVRQDGRKKLYSITPTGKNFLSGLSKKQDNMLGVVAKHLEEIADTKEMEQFYSIHKSMEGMKEKMTRDMDVMWRLNRAIFRIYEDGDEKSRKKMRDILNSASRQIERIN